MLGTLRCRPALAGGVHLIVEASPPCRHDFRKQRKNRAAGGTRLNAVLCVNGRCKLPESVTTFLMFEGNAEAAIRLYESAFEGLQVITLERYGPDDGENAGALKEGPTPMNKTGPFRCSLTVAQY